MQTGFRKKRPYFNILIGEFCMKKNTETITGRNLKKITIESEQSNIKEVNYKNIQNTVNRSNSGYVG